MALQFQDLPIPLVAGQNAGRDAALIQPPDFLKVTNGEFADRGNIRAVDGLTGLVVTAMTGETAPDDVNPTLRRLMTHKDELLLETYKGIFRQQVGGSFALAMSSSNQKRVNARAMRMGVTSIADAQGTSAPDWDRSARPVAGTLGVDAAQIGDYTCLVWAEVFGTGGTSRTQVSWQIRHTTSDTLVGRGRIRDGVGSVIEPRVVAFGGQFRIFAISGGDIGYLFIDPASTQNVSEALTKYTALGTYQFMDVALGPTDFCISATTTAPAVQSFVFTQAAPTVLVGAPAVAAAGACTPVANFYIAGGGGGVGNAFIAVFACGGTLTQLRWFAASTGGAGLGQGVSGALTGVTTIGRPVAFKGYTGSAAGYPILLDTLNATDPFQIIAVTYNGTAAAPGILSSGVASAIIVSNHMCMGLPLAVGSTFTGAQTQGLLLPVQAGVGLSQQNVYQVLDVADALAVVTAVPGTVGSSRPAEFSALRVFDAGAVFSSHYSALGGVYAIGRVCTVLPTPTGTGVYAWCAKFTPNITDVNNLGANPTNIQRNTLAYDDKLGSIEFADVTYMAGGTPLVYDGQDVFEEGFTYAPDAVSVATTAGGALEAGTYLVCFVYEWFDGQGNRWQSAPGNSIQFVAVKNDKYTPVVRSYTPTLKSGVQIIPYRTAAGGTVFYRDSPLNVACLSDSALQRSELLYTGPGVLTFVGTQSNNALPGVKNFTVHQNRLVAIGGEFERGFFYSKERSLRFPAEFNRASGFGLVPEVVGRVAAGSSIDDKLALFAESGISVVFGQGPNFNWLQNGYTAPVRIQAAEGIRFDSPFIGEVDEGVWYVTGLGPRLLTRGLATAKDPSGNPLGDELRSGGQALIGACESVTVHPVKAQVLFRSNTDNLTYVYDYQRNKWTQRNDFGTTMSMVSARGVLYLIRSDLLANTPLRYEDVGSQVRNTLTLETGWISFAGVLRFQRFSNLQVLGCDGPKPDITSNYELRVRVYGVEQPLTLVQDTPLTIAAPFSSNTPWRADFQMVKQTDTAYKLIIDITPDDFGGNFSITGLLATVGLKRGGAKLPNAQRG